LGVHLGNFKTSTIAELRPPRSKLATLWCADSARAVAVRDSDALMAAMKLDCRDEGIADGDNLLAGRSEAASFANVSFLI
jgi:hypothetical protein